MTFSNVLFFFEKQKVIRGNHAWLLRCEVEVNLVFNLSWYSTISWSVLPIDNICIRSRCAWITMHFFFLLSWYLFTTSIFTAYCFRDAWWWCKSELIEAEKTTIATKRNLESYWTTLTWSGKLLFMRLTKLKHNEQVHQP